MSGPAPPKTPAGIVEELRVKYKKVVSWSSSKKGPDHNCTFAQTLTISDPSNAHLTRTYSQAAPSKTLAKNSVCEIALKDILSWAPNHVVPPPRVGPPPVKNRQDVPSISILTAHYHNSPMTLSFKDLPDPDSSAKFYVEVYVDATKVGSGASEVSKQDAKHLAANEALALLDITKRDKEREERLAWVGDRALYMLVGLMGEEKGWSAERMNNVSTKLFSNKSLCNYHATANKNVHKSVHEIGTDVEKAVGEEVVKLRADMVALLRQGIGKAVPGLLDAIDEDLQQNDKRKR